MSMSSFLLSIKLFQALLYNSHILVSLISLHTVCSIWLIDWTLSDDTTQGQSEPGSKGNEGIVHIPRIHTAAVLPSDFWMSYTGYPLWGSYSSAEIIYSTGPAAEAGKIC